ncbi:N-acetyltransferase [Halobacillus fulvus]|nr:N-acetyltransferase [Halobacillus fulvus]
MKKLEESERIYLREIVLNDWSFLHTFATDEEACKFQPWGPNTEDDSRFFVNQAIRDGEQRHRSRFVFAVVEKEDETVIGNVEMNIIDWDGVGEIGFIIHPSYWGKGLGTEALCLLLKHSFEKCELHRVCAKCNPENYASIKVLERVGMVKEGTLRQDMYVKGRWCDNNVFGMLKEEWMSRYESAGLVHSQKLC